MKKTIAFLTAAFCLCMANKTMAQVANNLSIQSIEQLSDGALCEMDYVPLKVKVANTGTLDYNFATNPVTFSIRVSNPNPFNYDTVFSTGVIQSGVIDTLELTAMFPIMSAGVYDIEVFLNSSVDNIKSDDTVRTSYVSKKIRLPIDADFSYGIPVYFASMGLNTSHKWEFITQGTGADTVVKPQFGTGMIAFKGSIGSMSILSTQQLDLSHTTQSSLSFWYFHDTIPCQDSTNVRITMDGGTSYITLFSLAKHNAVYGWRQYNIDMPSYAINQCVILIFEAIEKSNGNVTQYIDRIRITAKQDIAVTDILVSEYSVCDLQNKNLKVVLSNLTDPVLNFSTTPITVTLKVQETGQTFTHSLTGGFLGSFSTDTFTLTTGFDFNKGTYTFKSYFSSVLDVNRQNDTLVTSITINPKLNVQLIPVSGWGNCLMAEELVWQDVILINTGNMPLSDIELILQIDTGETGSPAYVVIKEICTDTILAGDSLTYTFKNSYMVPWTSDFYPIVSAYLSCDSALVNKRTAIIECVDTKDLYIVNIDNPSSSINKIGNAVQVQAILGNRDDLNYYTGLNITVVVTNSQGVLINKFTETTGRIGASSTLTYTFISSYIVPNDTVYYLRVYIDSYDNNSYNDTLIIRIHTVTDDNYNDLFIIGIDNPATVTDTIGKNIHAVTSIRNQSNDSFANVNITLKVRNSQGEITETFIEMIGYIAPMETISYTFTKSYMVPNDSLYDLMIYIDSYDNYPENDTVILWRTIYNNNILYYVTVTANDTNMGRVSGDGYYAENTDTSIVAIPNNGCRFVQWNDGNTQNPRTITVTQDTMFTAIFDSVRYNLSLNINDISRGVVSGNGTYAVNSIATITAVPNVGYRFVGWDDGNKDSVRIITVTRNISLIALFGIEGMYYVYAAPTDPKMGSVIGSNDYHKSNGKPEFKREYAANSVASIEAIPNTGYRFIAWNDGNTDNPREFTVTGDSIFMAIFDIGTAIEDIETSNIKLYPNPTTNNIHITLPQNVDHAVFTLYDMQGKILIKQNINNQDAISVSNLAAGIYIYNVTTDKENHVGKLKIKN